jgi:predicted transcriptional regulator
MAATSLKLPDDLKLRIADLVDGTGQSAHAFMVEAIEQAAERAVLRRRFGAEALDAEAEALRTGKAYAADEVFEYLAAKARGTKATRPRARAWRA